MVTVYTVLGRAFALSRLLQRYPAQSDHHTPVYEKFQRAFGDDAGYLYDKLRFDCLDKVDEWIDALDTDNTAIFFTHEAFAR